MANAPSQNRKLTKKTPQDLNIMPIMNMFLVIIPMLLMLMVTVNLALLGIDYSASANASNNNAAGKGKNKKEEKGVLTLKIMMDKFQIDFGLKKKKPIDIPVLKEGSMSHYDYLSLDQKLDEIKKTDKFQDEKTIFVLTEPDVYYDALIKSIDLCKQDGFPNVKYIAAKTIYLKKK